jgi:hypothetical protein
MSPARSHHFLGTGEMILIGTPRAENAISLGQFVERRAASRHQWRSDY